MANTLSLSVYGDRKFINALSILAKKRGISIGLLVRQALDAQYGSELAQVASFFENGDTHTHHSVPKKITRGRKTKEAALP